MGGSSISDGSELDVAPYVNDSKEFKYEIRRGSLFGGINIVLVGCTGNGKSATGNSILGRKAFRSVSSFCGVTSVCQQEQTLSQCGKWKINVIDTPGLFDSASKRDMIEREIVRCISMARDGIHAVLIVVSLKTRFSDEQVEAVHTLKHLFGPRILDYMIVAFTGGDQLEENESTLDDHLANCPNSLKELIESCGNRKIVFDNKTRDEGKKAAQIQELLALVGDAVEKNGGNPCSTLDFFIQHKSEAAIVPKAYDEEMLLQRIAAMVCEKLNDRENELIKKLEEELLRVQKELNEFKISEEQARQETQKLNNRLVAQEKKWCRVM